MLVHKHKSLKLNILFSNSCNHPQPILPRQTCPIIPSLFYPDKLVQSSPVYSTPTNMSNYPQSILPRQTYPIIPSLFYPDKLGDVTELAPGSPALLKGTKVVKLDPTNQKVTLSTGEVIKYGKCLLAPGTELNLVSH